MSLVVGLPIGCGAIIGFPIQFEERAVCEVKWDPKHLVLMAVSLLVQNQTIFGENCKPIFNEIYLILSCPKTLWLFCFQWQPRCFFLLLSVCSPVIFCCLGVQMWHVAVV